MADLLGPTGKQIPDHSLEVKDLPVTSDNNILIGIDGKFVEKKHSDLDEFNGIHKIPSFIYTTLSEMENAIPSSSDIGKVARVGDSFYILAGISPNKWNSLSAPITELDGGTATSEYSTAQIIDGGNS